MHFGNTEMVFLGAALLIFCVYVWKAQGRWKEMECSGLFGHLFWLAVWYGFYLAWGKFRWRTAEYGSPEWMFDNYGHALGGFIGGFQGMYELWYFFPFLYYDRGRALRWFSIYTVIPAVVIFAALLFEVGEMIHDLQGYAVQAQKGGADTTIDIALAFFFAYLGIPVWFIYSRIKERIRRRWSSIVLQDQVAELDARARIWLKKANALREERRELVREFRMLRRKQVKDIAPNILASLKEVLGLTKDEEERENDS